MSDSDYISEDGFDHSGCNGRNLPPCTVDNGHGHAASFVAGAPAAGVEDINQHRVVFACKQCMYQHLSAKAMQSLASMLGPVAALIGGGIEDPITADVMDRGYSPDEFEKVLLDRLADYPGDESITTVLDEFRKTRAMVEQAIADEQSHGEGVQIVQPISANDFARLMAASPANTYPNEEEVN